MRTRSIIGRETSRILFVCSSLEPGRDGVGDYTRRLGVALAEMGACVHAIALHDRHQANCSSQDGEIQETSEGRLHAWRFSSRRAWPERIAALQDLVRQIEPDWISLQFVPYGFNDKGLPFLLPHRFGRLKGAFRWHIMFHELWVGGSSRSSIKERMVGRIQRYVVKRMVSIPRLDAVTTSNAVYQQWLKRIGCRPDWSPVFSNIKDEPTDGWSIPCLPENCFKIGMLGSINPGWAPDRFATALSQWLCTTNREAAIFGIGRSHASEESKNLIQRHFPRLSYVPLGHLPSAHVASVLKQCDAGLLTTPARLWQKSGVVAAFRHFGVPVLVERDDWNPRGDKERIPLGEGMIDCTTGLPNDFDERLRDRARRDVFPEAVAYYSSLFRC